MNQESIGTGILPKISVPKYSIKLPSIKNPVSFRPFLVKEEKILLIAAESESEQQIMGAIRDIISECTYKQVDVKDIPSFEAEYLFLNLRAKSKGETVKLSFKCTGKECTKVHTEEVDLTKIKISNIPKGKDALKIQLNDDIGIVMKYPTIMLKSEISFDPKKVKLQDAFNIMILCMDYIYDDKKIYKIKDVGEAETNDFLDGLTEGMFEKINSFFEKLPKVSHKINFKCKDCEKDNEIIVEGLQSFLG